MSNYILETKNLTKYYGKHAAVNNVSIRIKTGSIYGLLGPNGAGKTTLMKMLTGLLYPTNGEILIEGEKWKREHLKNMGALIESPALYGNLTAYENLKVHGKLVNVSESRINEVLEIVDLKKVTNKLASKFSLGMKQRLGIAIALLNRPKLLILDEPTNGLDPVGIQEMRQLISAFPKNGITVVVSSHILSEVEQLATEIGIINNGELKFQGSMDHNKNLESLFMEIVNADNRFEGEIRND